MPGRLVGAARQVINSAQQIVLSPGSSVAATNPVGVSTYAVLVSIQGDPSVPCAAMISVDHSGVASMTNGQAVRSTDRPVVIACAPKEVVAAYGLDDSGTVYITELN